MKTDSVSKLKTVVYCAIVAGAMLGGGLFAGPAMGGQTVSAPTVQLSPEVSQNWLAGEERARRDQSCTKAYETFTAEMNTMNKACSDAGSYIYKFLEGGSAGNPSSCFAAANKCQECSTGNDCPRIAAAPKEKDSSAELNERQKSVVDRLGPERDQVIKAINSCSPISKSQLEEYKRRKEELEKSSREQEKASRRDRADEEKDREAMNRELTRLNQDEEKLQENHQKELAKFDEDLEDAKKSQLEKLKANMAAIGKIEAAIGQADIDFEQFEIGLEKKCYDEAVAKVAKIREDVTKLASASRYSAAGLNAALSRVGKTEDMRLAELAKGYYDQCKARNQRTIQSVTSNKMTQQNQLRKQIENLFVERQSLITSVDNVKLQKKLSDIMRRQQTQIQNLQQERSTVQTNWLNKQQRLAEQRNQEKLDELADKMELDILRETLSASHQAAAGDKVPEAVATLKQSVTSVAAAAARVISACREVAPDSCRAASKYAIPPDQEGACAQAAADANPPPTTTTPAARATSSRPAATPPALPSGRGKEHKPVR